MALFIKKNLRGVVQVVRVLAFYSDDPSLNPADVNNYPVKVDNCV